MGREIVPRNFISVDYALIVSPMTLEVFIPREEGNGIQTRLRRSRRAMIAEGRGDGLRAQMLMLAVTCALFFPVLAHGQIFGQAVRGSVSPMGVSVSMAECGSRRRLRATGSARGYGRCSGCVSEEGRALSTELTLSNYYCS